CPTGALTIGPKDEMIKKAYARVQQLGGDANVYGDKFVGGTHMMYVLKEKPEVYEGIKQDPKVPFSLTVWKSWLKPLSLLGAGGVIGGALLHYILHGPHKPHPEHYDQDTKQGGA
ncbi:MAG TPA: formate dehydrogenase N subunit beta transmembrane domain-containing protein, partial [Smithella sp.]|nr:formate dehydrogenase N subunit beta transmembrane domain-containing protein [Smithella sp.]HOS15024.1 formate dehydrogenase N subunit beta transmembrane domain-containing protein [Smithella sp.]